MAKKDGAKVCPLKVIKDLEKIEEKMTEDWGLIEEILNASYVLNI
jgi:hypothetical protein|tara:strand:- start:1744 stop:1878 length:135 start_codon:yes stop_codon:yes gene_type:complete